MRLKRMTAAALAACAVAGLTACGTDDGLDGNVIVVDEHKISSEHFDHWVEANARAMQGPSRPDGRATPDAPKFVNCIARQKQQMKGNGKPDDKLLMQMCRQQYEQVREQTMQFLINSAWIQAEAQRLKLDVSDQELQARVKDTRAQLASSADGNVAQGLRNAGLTAADVEEQARIAVLSQKIRQRAFDQKVAAPTAEQLRSYYAANKASFGRPATRDVQLLGAGTRGQAQQAVQALRRGQAWTSVFKQFNKQPLTTTDNGRLISVPRNALPAAVDKLAFAAQPGETFGPVKLPEGGYIVGQVLKITAGRRPAPFSKIRSQVKQAWEVAQQQKNADKATRVMRDRWQPKTQCAKELAVEGCANAPKRPAAPATTPALTDQ